MFTLQKASTAGGSLERLEASAYITSPCYPKYEPVCYYIRLSVRLSPTLTVCMHADPPAASSVCVPSCPIVCFDLRHSTWSPSSSVPFPNTRHAPRCTSTGFIPPIPSRLCELLSKWREVKRKKSVFSSATIIRDKEETKASFRTHHFFFKRTRWSHTWKKS